MMSAMLSWLFRPSALEIFRLMLLAMSVLLTYNGQRPKLLLRLLCVLALLGWWWLPCCCTVTPRTVIEKLAEGGEWLYPLAVVAVATGWCLAL